MLHIFRKMLKRYTVSGKCDLKKFKGDKKLIKPLVFRLISIKKTHKNLGRRVVAPFKKYFG